jgi:hypothetical protein
VKDIKKLHRQNKLTDPRTPVGVSTRFPTRRMAARTGSIEDTKHSRQNSSRLLGSEIRVLHRTVRTRFTLVM